MKRSAGISTFGAVVLVGWLCVPVGGLLLPVSALAGFTETLPRGTFLLEESFIQSRTNGAYDNEGNRGPIIDDLARYEPGGGLQGIIEVDAVARYGILVNQLHYGLLDNLTMGIGIPVVLYSTVDPGLQWVPGDYHWTLGRAYSEEDFWEWAGSMGQPKPGKWSGNHGVLADSYLALRHRFTDGLEWFQRCELAMAFTLFGVIPTGKTPEPEEVVAAGTTAWDLHFQGEYGIHLSADKSFEEGLDGRLTLGLDLFHEIFLRHTYRAPKGTNHPLLLTYEPYVGETYTIDPGDFTGLSLQVELVPWKGEPRATWLSKGRSEGAADFPPLVSLTLRYTFIYLEQSDWESDSPLWDWESEKLWRPGYKNILHGTVTLSLLRVGIPVQAYLSYRNQTWIPGRNFRAVNAFIMGARLPLRFW